MIVSLISEEEYTELRQKFFTLHEYMYNDSIEGDEYGEHYHTYTFSDGAVWKEHVTREYVNGTVEILKCKTKINVELKKTVVEFDGYRYYFYESLE